MTDDIVGAYLRLDRAIGNMMEFVGYDKETFNAEDQKELTDAVAELDAAQEDMQKLCYKIGGVK